MRENVMSVPSSSRRSYTIAAVSKLTGVSCHALRAWERRYHFPIPLRSDSGHRRYDADQVRLLRKVSALIRLGRAVGEVMAEVLAGRLGEAQIEAEPAPREIPAKPELGELVDRLGAGDFTEAENLFERLSSGRDPVELATQVIEPCLVDVGERWFRSEFAIVQERCSTHFLTRKLLSLIDAAQRKNPSPRRTAILAALQGERHQGGLLIFGLLLELNGWRVVPLGTDLPFSELMEGVRRWRPDAVGISFVLSRSITKRFQELSQVRDVPVFVGGRSILNYQRLARQCGLIPLPGPALSALPFFLDSFKGLTVDETPLRQE